MCLGESESSSAPRDRKPIRPANSSLGRATSSPRSFSFFFPSLPTYSFLLDPTVKLASDNSKVSSLLAPRGISFPPDVDTGPHRLSPSMTSKQGRRRRSSSLIYQEPAESIEHTSDQAALPNLNANWVNAKGAWTIHFVCIAALKIFYDIIPGVSQETSWTLTNISYMFGSFLMFHWVRGIPFEFNAGAYDNLNMWEQIDNGDQYTPAKKFLLCVPIVLFLLSTHYTHFDLTHFTINFLATLGVVIPKLPFSHRLRIGLFSDIPEES
ncbi:hypothetical protein N7527_006376 [Penicillium freii]|uniref:Uncharacterized protein n=1 Tax=Penicillium freii TaxID=48697 RepID=A0A101MLB0_PENFR|nr:hypothetical protein N7527_006376 [Penicillium freii]KUM62655.1 hypothetical protein ACN42_g4427 [Penicillium freii]